LITLLDHDDICNVVGVLINYHRVHHWAQNKFWSSCGPSPFWSKLRHGTHRNMQTGRNRGQGIRSDTR